MGNANHGNRKIGYRAECPSCGQEFPANTTHFSFNSHLDSCLTDPKKAEENRERLKHEKQRKKGQQANFNITIRRNDDGAQQIITQQGESQLSYEDIKRIRKLPANTIKGRPTKEKMIWFQHWIKKQTEDFTEGYNEIVINRESFLEDAFSQFMQLSSLRKELKVTFQCELSQDAGGVSREFFQMLMKDFLDQKHKLFAVATTRDFSYKVDENSELLPHFSQWYKFFGRALGKSLFDNITINVCLNKAIFKALVDEVKEDSYTLEEMSHIDYNVYNSLKFFRDNSLKDFEDTIEQYFTSDRNIDFIIGNEDQMTVDLIKNGKNIRVTDENKHEFIKKKIHYVAYKQMQHQLCAIAEGFWSVIDKNVAKVFNSEELEAAICGQSIIDINDWMNNTEYKGGFKSTSSTIKMFWEILASYTQQELSRVLQFTTGTSRLPLGGFQNLESNRGEKAKFCIYQIKLKPGESDLPKAHTCFNRLELSKFSTKEKLKNALDFIAKNDIVGFGLEE